MLLLATTAHLPVCPRWESRGSVLRICPSEHTTLDMWSSQLKRKLTAHQSFNLGKLTRAQAVAMVSALQKYAALRKGGGQSECNMACAWPVLSCSLNETRSQQRQDLILLPRLLELSRSGRGSFVELGAMDGWSLSNTALLERCFGWDGVLIEANPHNARKLLKSGRKARTVHKAVCSAHQVPATVKMTIGGGNVAKQTDITHPSVGQSQKSLDRTETTDVQCSPLHNIITEGGLNAATFLSLDVEGAEAIVLRTIDPRFFYLIMVEEELDVSTKITIAAVRQLLGQAGFAPAEDIHVAYNKVFIK